MASTVDGPAKGGISPYLVTLLALAMFLNYTDRGSLSIVAPVLKQQLGISNAAMGLLLSAFFWSYAIAQPAAGWVAQRFAPRTVLAVATGLWSLATIACGLATGIVMLFVFRMLLGLAESAIFPTNARIFAEHAPEHQRGRCNSAMSVGHSMGPTAGTLIGAMVLIAYGWRAVFFVLGGISLLWLIPWLARRDPALESGAARRHQPAAYSEILRQRSLWGACAAQFCYSYPFYLVLTWLPLYLVNSQHLSLGSMAGVTAALYALQAIAAVLSGWASDLLIARGHSSTWVRKGFVSAGMTGTGLLFAAAGLTSGVTSTVLLIASGFTVGISGTMVFTIGQTLAGPRAGGRWMGFQNMLGNFSGIAAPIITGLVVDWSGSFAGAFFVASALSAIGVLCWIVVVRDIRPVAWSDAAAPALAGAAPLPA
ncbi:MAG: MFS transporter [Sphingomicrobium sp.]